MRAGSLSAVLSGIDLAHVASGEVEVARLIQVAVRDEVWGTIPPVVSDLCVERDEDAFLVTFRALCAAEEIEFEWSGRIEGTPGRNADLRDVGRGRPGLPLRPDRHLRPPSRGCLRRLPLSGDRRRAGAPRGSFRGRSSRSVSSAGSTSRSRAPGTASRWSSAPDVTASFAFEGDEFEMEDQRNWTDATFKTYSTPLSLGLVHEAVAGRRSTSA